jgi:antitoxin PrlF
LWILHGAEALAQETRGGGKTRRADILDICGRNSYDIGMKTTVSEKGQVTIPKAIRDKLGLRPGTVLDFDAIEGKLIGVKKEQDDRIGRWLGKGSLPGALAVDDYLRRIRG